MQLTRFITAIVALSLWALATSACSQEIKSLAIEFDIKDEGGNPIPHVTVWRVKDPCGLVDGRRAQTGSECFEGKDLERTAKRLIESFEYAASYSGPKPFRAIEIPPGADANGQYRESGTGSVYLWGLNQPLVKVLKLTFAFLKQGYEPSFKEIVLTHAKNEHRDTIVMKLDSRFPRQATANRAEFERIRYELSDWRRNSQMSLENAQRLADLRARLEKLAADAEAGGEQPLAALAHWRIKFMPTVFTEQKNGATNVVGFNAGGGDDLRDGVAKRTYRLDPDNPYHNLTAAFGAWPDEHRDSKGHLRKPVSEADRKFLSDFVDRREANIRENMSRLWPNHVMSLTHLLKLQGDFERAYRWIKEFEAIEPKFDNFDTAYTSLGWDMKSAKVPIPPEWKLDQYK